MSEQRKYRKFTAKQKAEVVLLSAFLSTHGSWTAGKRTEMMTEDAKFALGF